MVWVPAIAFRYLNLINMISDWAPEDCEIPPGSEGGTTHLWDESWDDDDTSEDFSKQLKYSATFGLFQE